SSVRAGVRTPSRGTIFPKMDPRRHSVKRLGLAVLVDFAALTPRASFCMPLQPGAVRNSG
ncbi:MAG: hypothetical protein ABIQ99_04895, partial [Thermoflexales bacterium]